MPAGKIIWETIVKPEFKKRGDIFVPNLILLPCLPAVQIFEDILEDDPDEGIKSVFITEDFIERSTIWMAEPRDALKNWTSAPSLVRRDIQNYKFVSPMIMTCEETKKKNMIDQHKLKGYKNSVQLDKPAKKFEQLLDEIEILNLGNSKLVREVRINARLEPFEKEALIE
ncbi:hypothetical protein H5410_016437 [Solanum commersonii]|uniref:Uncharacterized protein n=1 Tax=Solanum commersonii TaxID=4109 RepID=A0A9J5ZW91_SOLCO|nr:hypothetical protein H5410_016437 [Solanum commersonii]